MRIALLLLIGLISFSCKSTKFETITESNLPYLTLTSGGGFAGTYTTYVLVENGQIFEQKQDIDTATPVGMINKDEATQIFGNYDFLNMDQVEKVYYGNYTYSITKTEGGDAHKIMWEKDQAGAEVYQVFYKNVMAAISKNRDSFKPKTPSKKN